MSLYQEHICPDCKRKATYYAVNEINQQAPCTDCMLKRIGRVSVEVEVLKTPTRKEAQQELF